ncbi:hypothetical protein Csa_016616 [Cucumis sativus]|nr:hypothetical protein Csa_016616 [Cucumis sativus]
MDEIEIVKCECCGLKEECTKDYISEVKANFDAKWLCGLCSQAVGDEILFRPKNNHHSPPQPPPSSTGGIQDAVNAHMLFCRLNIVEAMHLGSGQVWMKTNLI